MASPGHHQSLFSDVRCPTQKQFELLFRLGAGAAWLSAKKRQVEPMLARGWVTAEWRPPYYQWVRIAPKGLAALALGVEKFGLHDLAPVRQAKVCSDCDRDWNPRCKCGGRSYRYVEREIEAQNAA